MSANSSPSPGRGPSRLGRLLQPVQALGSHRWIELLANRPPLVIGLAGISAFVGCVVYALLNGIPQPAVHDEFSYLLAGDTFASGRLTNPTHPMWRHFETFHVLQQPTYASKYPPGQGAFLALGQILGHPILGVWLSVALMAAGISWMLYQWVPPKWALLGSALAIVQVGFPTYWGQSYWGGAVAALGGALVYGSLRAAANEPRLRHGLLFGTGAMLLATTRPLEGGLVGLPAGLVLIGLAAGRKGPSRALLAGRAALPAAMILAATVVGLGYQNWRVTGDPLQLPYQVYNRTYHMGAQFPWQEPSPVVEYPHKPLSDFKEFWILQRAESQREDPIPALTFKLFKLENFFLGPGLLVLLLLPAISRSRWVLLAAAASGAVVVAVLLTKAAHPHYASPATGLFLILVIEGLRRLHEIRTKAVFGPTLVTLVVLGYLPFLAFRPMVMIGPEMTSFSEERNRTLGRLRAMEGDDLVIVRYGERHNFLMEWVYNRASMDASDVVWAREMSPEENRELTSYFDERRIWLLEPDGSAALEPDGSAALEPDGSAALEPYAP
jgi:hypothetical protein